MTSPPPKSTMYLEGLPFSTTQTSLHQFIQSCGVKMVGEVRMSTWQDSGRSRGYAHVDFDSDEALKVAIELLDNKQCGDRYVRASRANDVKTSGGGGSAGNIKNSPSKTLFVKNLSYQTTEDNVADAFTKLLPVKVQGVRIPRHGTTGLSKGICYVEFANVDETVRVVQAIRKLVDFVIDGRVVQLDYDDSQPRAGFKDRSRKLQQQQSPVTSEKTAPATKRQRKNTKRDGDDDDDS